jgi:NAD(P)H dehydrogenase (quinone)
MSYTNQRILVTGASGHLGRLIVESLLKKVRASQVVVSVRSKDKAKDLSALGVEVREADYTKPETLAKAYQGIDRLLLVSSNELGQRFAQHRNVIDAAKRSGVKLIAYTSILHGEASPLGLKDEHIQTEVHLRSSGVPYVLLRNGWYTENYFGMIPSALEHGALFGSAGNGRIASAARSDYAEATAAVLAADGDHGGKVYELAGDEAYTLTEWAKELSRQSGKSVEYKNLPEADYRALLVKVGLPEPVAAMLADSDVGASKGGLFDDSHTLSKLIGRPTTPLKVSMAEALKS